MSAALTPAAALTVWLLAGPLAAGQVAPPTAIPPSLVAALRQGGHVIVMRHANAPAQVPDAASANSDNTGRERQLDAAGRAGATAFGAALRRLAIPVGDVLTSPTYRARETARLAGLTSARAVPELGEASQTMATATLEQIAWLRQRAIVPARGTNTVLITHSPNIIGAFPVDGAAIAQGEALVFGAPQGGTPTLVARIPIEAWGLQR